MARTMIELQDIKKYIILGAKILRPLPALP